MSSSQMRRCVCVAALIFASNIYAHGVNPPATTEYRNGLWFDGKAFQLRTFYSVNGVLMRVRPPAVEAVVDLKDKYVVPPFAEAHNHNIEGEWNIKPVVQKYLADGVYYVQITGQIPDFSAGVQKYINRPDSIEVTFSNGGFTGSGGHPEVLYQTILRQYRYGPLVGNLDPHWFDKRAYYVADSKRDLERHWPEFLKTKPAFVKVYLVCAEVHDRPNNYCKGRKGLDPRLVPDIVELARKANLKVVAHVETAEDFRIALAAGVHEIAHLPGWFLLSADLADRARLTDGDAALAVTRNVTVHTTTVASRAMGGMRAGGGGGHAHGHGDADAPDAKAQGGGVAATHEQAHARGDGASQAASGQAASGVEKAEREVQIANLRLLQKHGARLVIGADHADTPLPEAMNVHSMRIFSNLELLNIWTVDTALTVFPNRKIGKLDEGYEASFLVLDGDPIADFQNVRRISMRVKQGRVLSIDPAAPAQSLGHSH